MAFRIEYDSYYSSIYETPNRFPNNEDEFATYGEAKAVLMEYLMSQKAEWQHAINELRKSKKGGM
jgi:hypothetical protein